MILNFSDARDYRMGAAIRDIVVAFGGWMDWGADGKVRFLCRGHGGAIGMFFPGWLMDGIRDQRNAIKRFVEIEREERSMRK